MTTQYFGPPNPGYYNLPINAEYFQPSRFVISNVSLGVTTVITTSVPHNYVIGQLIRLLFQPNYGCSQLNQQLAYVIAIPSTTQVTLDLNSIGVDAFVASPSFGPTLPQIVAVGDKNTGLISSTGRSLPTTTIPGSFQNISPF